jgi:pseudouridine kinase
MLFFKTFLIRMAGAIMINENYSVVIGAANIDIQGFSYQPLVMEDSNPGKVRISPGGVGRNIAENLAKLGSNVKLITVLGDDPYSNNLLIDCKSKNIDTLDSLIIKNMSSPVYLSILEENGDMKLAVCDAEVLEKLTVDFIKTKHSVIEKAEIILLDTNLPKEVLEYITITYCHKPLFVDTVSTHKSLKIKDLLGCFDTIKVNLLEAEALADITINNTLELSKLLDFFLSKGVKHVFITLGENGVYYGNKNYSNIKAVPKIKVVNATGAGDAFMAALIYSSLNHFDIDFTSSFAIAASILALYHEDTINPNMSISNINNLLEELKLC